MVIDTNTLFKILGRAAYVFGGEKEVIVKEVLEYIESEAALEHRASAEEMSEEEKITSNLRMIEEQLARIEKQKESRVLKEALRPRE